MRMPRLQPSRPGLPTVTSVIGKSLPRPSVGMIVGGLLPCGRLGDGLSPPSAAKSVEEPGQKGGVVVTVARWTGEHARVLREVALRMSIYQFAAHTGLSVSTVRDMEAKGQRAQLRTSTQKILDEALAAASEHARQRFAAAVTGTAGLADGATAADASSGMCVQRGLVDGGGVNRRDLLAGGGVAVAAAVLLSPAMEAVGAAGEGPAEGDLDGVDQPMRLPALLQTAARLKYCYQAGDLQGVVGQLPGALAAARTAAGGGLGAEGCQVAADIYQTACSVLIKLGEVGLALLAADRCSAAAERSGDPVAVGASARALAHAVASNGHTSRAVAIATAAAQRLEQASGLSTAPEWAVYGALLLRGAILAAEGEDRATALALVGEAEQAACRLEGDDNVYGTYFCARNVRLHQLSIAVRLGDAGQAVAHAAKVDPAEIRLRERRAAYYLDLARAFTQWGKYQQAYQALLGAEHAAWQELALRPACQELLAELLCRCPPGMQPRLRQLADRIGVSV